MGKGICMNKLKQMETALSPGGGQQAVDQMDNQTLLLRYKETGLRNLLFMTIRSRRMTV